MRLLINIISLLIVLSLFCGCKEQKDVYNGWTDLGPIDVCDSDLPIINKGGTFQGVPLVPNLIIRSDMHLYMKTKNQTIIYGLHSTFSPYGYDVIGLRPINKHTSTDNNYQDGYYGYNYEGITSDGETVYVRINN